MLLRQFEPGVWTPFVRHFFGQSLPASKVAQCPEKVTYSQKYLPNLPLGSFMVDILLIAFRPVDSKCHLQQNNVSSVLVAAVRAPGVGMGM